MTNELAIVIPVHNRLPLTRQCLRSLRSQTCQEFNVIVVDDGSTDGTDRMLASEFPEVTVLKGDGNLWWTAATNLGVRRALGDGCKRIMTLNDDTKAEPDFIEQMLKWSRKRPEALLGALAIDAETREPVYGGEIVNWWTGRNKQLLDGVDDPDLNGLHEVTHFPGRGLLVPREVFTRIGMYEEKRLPHYGADYDFTHRAVRAGFRLYCNFDAKLGTYPKASGDRQTRQTKDLAHYRAHLFSIRGGGNLRVFWTYAVRNCPPAYLPSFLIRGTARRLVGFWLH